ncbi:hypothetical protein LCGC14_1192380 [marine sediment metagenome]|uniref:Leucine-rich repeat domain-containing protein n=1 Tax=marine sediment metagenome TaxID=412755 RepID=A0A0F9LJ61_9ZZZZ
MEDFRINEFIVIKLENNKTIIYINEERFDQCRFLLLNIPINYITPLEEVDSIDEAAEKLDSSLEREGKEFEIDISPEVRFWAHCSNLQVWAENGYDTRILHSNLSFPLLKKLSRVGDSLAKKVFSEEIAKRIERGYFPVIEYLINEGYLDYLNDGEFLTLIESPSFNIPYLMEKFFDSEISDKTFKIYRLFERIKALPKNQFHQILIDIYKCENPYVIKYLNEESFDKEIGREKYYFSLLEPDEAKIMLELERLLEIEAWVHEYFSEDGECLEIIIKNRSVIKMDICIRGLETIVEPVLHLKNLKELHYYGPIVQLPRDIDKLKNLEKLMLYENEIKELPESICNMISLRLIDLQKNPIQCIPDSLKSLPLLKIKS